MRLLQMQKKYVQFFKVPVAYIPKSYHECQTFYSRELYSCTNMFQILT